MLSLRKKFLFGFSTVVFAIVLIAGLELVLRAMNPLKEDAIVSTVAYDGIDWYKLNRSYLKQYFSSTDALVPELKDELFRVKRTDRSIRIFCLGESSMFGVPYQLNANIPAIIRKQLRFLYPDREVEVINAAASAINSSVILDLAGRIADFQPDLVLIYLGHNEFYGPEGVGASKLEKILPLMTEVKRSVKKSALVRTIGEAFPSKPGEHARSITLMEQVSNDTKVDIASADAERIFSNYEKNLRAMITVLQSKRIPVMFSDAASNLSFPPFEYPSPGEHIENEISSLIRAGNYAQLSSRLDALMKTDTANAFLCYWKGIADERLGEYGEARIQLVRAKDLDLLKFRAPERTNAILHRVCAELNVPCISSDSLLCASSPHGISDTTLFWEHVHPNAYGYYLIASHFIRMMAAHGLIPDAGRAASQRLLPFQPDSLSICFIDLAYGDRLIKNLTGHWPFRNYSVSSAVLNSADGELRDIVEKMFTNAYTKDEACYRSAAYFLRNGRLREAQTSYEAVIESYPYNYYPHYMLGNLLNRMNKPAEALKHFTIAVKSNPSYVHARVERGLTLTNFGRYDEALADFAAARQFRDASDPSLDATIAYGMAVVYANKRDFTAALRSVDEALRIAPTYASAIQLRAGIAQAMK
jgi:tetratricopeptide (TPR) repeat protein